MQLHAYNHKRICKLQQDVADLCNRVHHITPKVFPGEQGLVYVTNEPLTTVVPPATTKFHRDLEIGNREDMDALDAVMQQLAACSEALRTHQPQLAVQHKNTAWLEWRPTPTVTFRPTQRGYYWYMDDTQHVCKHLEAGDEVTTDSHSTPWVVKLL